MGRSYKEDGVSYPSVTTVLGILDKSAALMPWAVNMALQSVRDSINSHFESTQDAGLGYDVLEEFLQIARKEWRKSSTQALEIGSSVHDAIECYLKFGKDKTQEEIYCKADMTDDQKNQIDNAFLAFLDWYGENVEECIQAEMTVIEKTHGYAGTLDFIGRMKDGRVMLIDWKSSKGFYEGYNWQLYAYRNAVEEMQPDLKIDSQGVLRLDKITGLPEWKEYTDYEKGRDTFISLLDFYYRSKKRRLAKNPFVKENWG